jgi:putative peptidoglycan lipid II flippase
MTNAEPLQLSPSSYNNSDADAGANKLAKNSLSVAIWTAVSRITGFGRVAMIGAVLGPTYLSNIYQATNSLPNITFGLLTGSLFVTLLVPPLVRHIDANDRLATERLAGAFLGTAVVVFGAVALLMIALGPLVLRFLSLGVQDSGIAATQRRAGWLLLVMLMPQLVLYAIAGTGEAVMNAHGRFALAAAAPALENIGIMATMGATAIAYGTGVALSNPSGEQLRLLGLGTTAAVGLHAGVQWWGARRVGVRLVPRFAWREPDIRAIIGRAIPSLGSTGLYAVQRFGALVVANRVPGGVVAFDLAYNFYSLPFAVGARPVAVSILPMLSRLAHGKRLQAFRDELVRGAALIAFLTVPAAVAYATLAYPLSRAVSFGEMATPTGAALIGVSVLALAPGVVGSAALLLATYASYAWHDAKSPFHAMLVGATLTLSGFVLAFLFTDGIAVLVVLGLAVSVGDVTASLYLANRIRVRLPTSEARLGPALLRALGGSAVMVAPAYLIATRLPELLDARWSEMVGLLGAVFVGLALFIAAQALWRSPELDALLGGLRALQGRRGDHP